MYFAFEDKFNLQNFINCKDINKSTIPRFSTSPLLTSSQIYFQQSDPNEMVYFNSTDNIDGDYIISASVNHSPDDWTGHDPRVETFFSHLNEKYLKDLRDNKAYLMLDQSLEGYQTPWLWDYFHQQCAEWKVSPIRMIYVTGNMIADDVYEKWANDNNVI